MRHTRPAYNDPGLSPLYRASVAARPRALGRVVAVVSWFRRRDRQAAPRLSQRRDSRSSVRAASGSTQTLAPDRRTYLGRAAYYQLVSYQMLTGAVEHGSSLVGREAISLAAAEILGRHHGLTAELERMRADPILEMQKHTAELDAYADRIRGEEWWQAALSVYLSDGIMNDLFIALAPGLGADGARYADLLAGDEGRTVLVETLRAAVTDNPGLADRLALWGRRIIGDALLIVRSTLHLPADPDEAEVLAAAATTELIAAHTRRMDALGLTA